MYVVKEVNGSKKRVPILQLILAPCMCCIAKTLQALHCADSAGAALRRLCRCNC